MILGALERTSRNTLIRYMSKEMGHEKILCFFLNRSFKKVLKSGGHGGIKFRLLGPEEPAIWFKFLLLTANIDVYCVKIWSS